MNKIFLKSSKISIWFLGLIFLLNYSCDKKEDDPFSTSGDQLLLPRIEITTEATIVDEPKIPAEMKIISDQYPIESQQIGIEFRGSSSQMFPKKSYGFETWTNDNQDMDISIGGYPEEEDWILYAPYTDKSLVRNVIIYELSNNIGRYATKTSFYELFINDDYKGVYVLMEKIKRDKNRVAISKNNDADISGGYIIKIDKPTGDGGNYNSYNSFESKIDDNGKIFFLYEYPDEDDIASNQREYIQQYVHDFESSLYSESFLDPETGYKNYVDFESLIDFFLLNEISKNIDGYRLSTFMYKEKGGKLTLGPIWDFNLAFGNANYCEGQKPQGWVYQFNDVCPDDWWQVPFWWERFMEDPEFKTAIRNRWDELRSSAFSNSAILDRISAIEQVLYEHNAIERNFSKWPILGEWIWPNHFVSESQSSIGVPEAYKQETNYLKSWIIDRLQWMDGQISQF
tara:strand:+ start:248 stop:1615 length:1368 start_codon:yes stop_codon:yes gene_type:complete